MPTTKIKSDSRGLYVRTDGQIYRPQPSTFSYLPGVNGISSFKVGDEVSIAKVSQSPFCGVRIGSVSELWHSHGGYIESGKTADGKYKSVNKKSDTVWKPKAD